ncbi:hypothetical protein ABB37_09698 [Leptomonas pyrrhocoris]|uniref:Uncharacterized protein n=1 Tax=Leptomonas pyrrhocoris TaxID=157538 RepID=A0A0M9FPW9_LEPPY|nr:hypothetical protein ABB37_09698 [Leptomonas pyrrhocoris]KPA73563.1 hypothetical protein ABB37_09698 [Leptomonas pyrrhocoris]|eukprot:XP_015652002.1 hypothetical protein ABB37_09698 [Leptomonas pyrrhocoris]
MADLLKCARATPHAWCFPHNRVWQEWPSGPTTPRGKDANRRRSTLLRTAATQREALHWAAPRERPPRTPRRTAKRDPHAAPAATEPPSPKRGDSQSW